jgi:hypothetical protein
MQDDVSGIVSYFASNFNRSIVLQDRYQCHHLACCILLLGL